MSNSRYEYGTSPRKLQPDIKTKTQTKKRNLKVVKDLPRQDVKISKEQKKKSTQQVARLFFSFFVQTWNLLHFLY